ncbi:MAG: hypothetical protein AAF913_01625 [Pseudomonadota bacterium]
MWARPRRSDTQAGGALPRPLGPGYALLWIGLGPLVCPPVGIFHLGIAFAPEIWVKAGFAVLLALFVFQMDRATRGVMNANLLRLKNAIDAQHAASTGAEPSALLLRAFHEQRGYVDGDAGFSLFDLIEPALRRAGLRPVALGQTLPLPPDHGTAFVLTTDETWWSVFQELSRSAAILVLIPEITPSLQREMRWLREADLISKVILVMPPEALFVVHYTTADGGVEGGPAGPNAARKAGWEETVQHWARDLGVELPSYDRRGALITFGTAGTVRSSPLRSFGTESYLHAVRRRVLGYRRGFGVDFDHRLAQALGPTPPRGEPIREVWRRLQPAPLTVGPHPRFDPPGRRESVWDPVVVAACCGWGTFLGAVIVLWLL